MALFAGIGILQIWLTNWLVRHISPVINGGVDVENILTNFNRHDDFFQRTVTGTLADPVHCTFHWRAPACTAASELPTAGPKSSWVCTEIMALSMLGTRSYRPLMIPANSNGMV